MSQDWFSVTRLDQGIYQIRENCVDPDLRCNIWMVLGRDRNLLIDSGMGVTPLKPTIVELSEKDVVAVSSHAHFDHMGGAHEFNCHLGHRADAELFANPTLERTLANAFITVETIVKSPYDGFELSRYTLTPAPLTGFLDDGDVVDLGDRVFRVLHLPGHTPGSIALYENRTGILFSGDIVYRGGLIANAWHSNVGHYNESLQRLREIPVSTVHAGHQSSMDRTAMISIIDGFLSGGERLQGFDGKNYSAVS
ncbi:MAG: MBL fold metallo-hydrolase [Pseudomonadota bacterium]